MHQSSLGSMLLIAATKLHPLWHTRFLPLLFLINCIYIGYCHRHPGVDHFLLRLPAAL